MPRSTVPRKFYGIYWYRGTEYYRGLDGTNTVKFSTAVYRGYRKYRPTLTYIHIPLRANYEFTDMRPGIALLRFFHAVFFYESTVLCAKSLTKFAFSWH
jgi:hypothetical protein